MVSGCVESGFVVSGCEGNICVKDVAFWNWSMSR